MNKTKTQAKLINCIAIVFLVLQLIPILYLAQFNHPVGDDYKYGTASHAVWTSTGNLFKVIGAAAAGVKQDYVEWQGTYSALFLMRLQPTVFAESAYALVPWMMLGLLICSMLYLLKTVFADWCKVEMPYWITVAVLLSTICIQLAPNASEQFFWYNGAVYYNGFQGFMLLYIAWMLRFQNRQKIRYMVYLGLAAFVIAGGNYITVLTTMILTFTMIVYSLWKKNWKHVAVYGGSFLILLIGFAISAKAPGNAVRAAGLLGMSPVAAVKASITKGVDYYLVWADKWWLLVLLVLLPLMVYVIRRMTYEFPLPGLVLLYSYLVFCAMGTPTFYAMGSTGPGRVVNIVYDGFILTSYFQVFYLLGWYLKKKQTFTEGEGILTVWKKETWFVWLGLVGFLLVAFLLSGGHKDKTSVVAAKVWIRGDGKVYQQEFEERLKVLEDASVTDPVFHSFSIKPDLVFVADGTDDPNFVNNTEWAEFYGKNSIVVVD